VGRAAGCCEEPGATNAGGGSAGSRDIIRRVTGEDPEQRRTAAAELIAANPDVIVAAGIIDALPVHAQTRTIETLPEIANRVF